MTKYKYYFYGLLTLLIYLAGYFTHVKIHTCPIPEARIDTVIQYEVVIDEKVVPIFKVKIEKDTIYSTDTLIIKERIDYIAEKDTVYKDSLLHLRVQYVSDIPLSQKSYFNLWSKVREREITETVHKTETVTYNPNFFVEGGGRVGTEFNYYLMAGINLISFRHLKVLIYYELEHVPDGSTTHSMKFGTRIEF